MEILLIDDDQEDYLLTYNMLSSQPEWGGHLKWASSFEEGLHLICSERHDVILVDYYLGQHKGSDLISEAIKRNCLAPFILLTGHGSSDVDLEAIKAGATLYLTKNDLTPALLIRSIQFAIERRQAEQKQAELLQEVEKSRSELEGIFTAQNDIVLIYDTNMNVQRANNFFRDIFGFDPVGLNLREIVRRVNCRLLDGTPLAIFEDVPTLRALRGEKVAGASYLVTKADGSEAAVATSSGPIRVGEKITGSVTVGHDITERVHSELELRKSEARLKESEKRFRVALSSSQTYVFSMDCDLRYTWVHDPTEDLNIDRLIGKRDDEIWPRQDVEEIINLKQSVIDTGRSIQKEINFQIDHRSSWFIITLDPDFDKDGQVCGITGAALNISRLRSLEEERKENTARLGWLEAINLVNQTIASTTEFAKIYEKIAEIACQVFDTQHAFIAELDANEKHLKILAHTCRDDQHLELIGSFTTLPNVFQNFSDFQRCDLLTLAGEQVRLLDGPLGDHIHLSNVQSVIEIPLQVQERTLGLLGLEMCQVERTITKSEYNLLKIISTDIAQILLNAALFEQSKLLAAAEERNRIARELHDSIAQALFSINLYTDAIQMARKSNKMDVIDEHLQELGKLTREAMFDMRLLIYQLRPPELKSEGLQAALQNRIDAVESRAGFKASFETQGEFKLASDQEIQVYWIAQEILTNVLKHADAGEVKLQLIAEAGVFRMIIEDNGVGFDLNSIEQSGGQGLRIIQERAAKIGANCTISSTPGQGTKVILVMDIT